MSQSAEWCCQPAGAEMAQSSSHGHLSCCYRGCCSRWTHWQVYWCETYVWGFWYLSIAGKFHPRAMEWAFRQLSSSRSLVRILTRFVKLENEVSVAQYFIILFLLRSVYLSTLTVYVRVFNASDAKLMLGLAVSRWMGLVLCSAIVQEVGLALPCLCRA